MNSVILSSHEQEEGNSVSAHSTSDSPAVQQEVAAFKSESFSLTILPIIETPTLTKADLSDLLFQEIGLNKREAKDMVEAFFGLIHKALSQGEEVKLSGFGHFGIRRKSPRPGRNPRTGEPVPIEARSVVTFHASHKLKDIVQEALSSAGS